MICQEEMERVLWAKAHKQEEASDSARAIQQAFIVSVTAVVLAVAWVSDAERDIEDPAQTCLMN